ncbi:MAG: hypothetical protein G01um101425_721 [Candidatus Peregrinibacteria bacterium Gr01-1014_25]|nr:MAG: hypothetical protein G01um101425_721 [Candidatus Peregrinibacteria bacterium Gr01-1014_25]
MMDPETFFGPARRLRLTPEEKAKTMAFLRNHVRKVPVERQYEQMNAHGHSFAASQKMAQDLHLTPQERADARAVLRSWMAAHPVREHVSLIDRLFAFTHHPAMSAAVFLIAIVAGGGGLAYAAENTAPGDTLYAIKRAVNERFMRRMLSPDEWEARALERRMQEDALLARRGAPRQSRRLLVQEVKEHRTALVALRQQAQEKRRLARINAVIAQAETFERELADDDDATLIAARGVGDAAAPMTTMTAQQSASPDVGRSASAGNSTAVESALRAVSTSSAAATATGSAITSSSSSVSKPKIPLKIIPPGPPRPMGRFE